MLQESKPGVRKRFPESYLKSHREVSFAHFCIRVRLFSPCRKADDYTPDAGDRANGLKKHGPWQCVPWAANDEMGWYGVCVCVFGGKRGSARKKTRCRWPSYRWITLLIGSVRQIGNYCGAWKNVRIVRMLGGCFSVRHVHRMMACSV